MSPFTLFAAGVYRLLLHLLPRSFRREHGEETVALFRRTVVEARAAGGRWAGWGAALAGWAGVLRGWVEESAEGRRPTVPRPAAHQEAHRERRGIVGRTLRTMIGQAGKAVARAPGLAAGVVALLGLGIGATVTVLSVVDGVLVRSLPYPEPERLAMVRQGAHSWPDFVDWTETVPAFDAMAAASGQTFTLTGEIPQEIAGARVSERFFELMGAAAARGRLPAAEEYRQGRRVAVLGHAAWERRWGADPGIVGRTIPLDGQPVEVVGILAATFIPPSTLTGGGVEIWVPIDPADPDLDRHDRSFAVLGRLAPGATLGEAAAQLRARAEVFAREVPDYAEEDGSPRRTFPPVTLEEATTGDARSPLLVLLGGAALLLLVACGNAASLLLARGAARRGELAVRRALGGGRTAILGQLLVEALLLGLAGGAVGLALAAAGVELVRAFEPGDLPRVGEVAVDLRVGAASAALAVLAGLLAGLVPAWRAGRVAPGAALQRADAGARGRVLGGRLAGAGGLSLVLAEAALASLLLAGSLAVVRGFGELVATDPGFSPEGAYAVAINAGRDLPTAQRGADAESIRARLAALPGVKAVGAGLAAPFEISGGRRCCWVGELADEHGEGELDRIWVHPVTAGYFGALGIPFRSGRGFTPDERSEGIVPVVLNTAAAKELFREGEAVGGRLRFATYETQVVGVIEDVRHWGADQPVEPEFYLPYEPAGTWASGLTFVLRAATAPSFDSLRAAVAEVAPRALVDDLRPMRAVLAASLARQRFYASVLTAFAGCALVLAAAGLAGTMLYDTRRRRHELGIRVALGATSGGLVRGAVARGLGTVGAGAVIGLAAFWPLRRHLASLVPGADPVDPLALAGFGALLAAAALAAVWVPARLLVRTDPARALR